MAAHVCSTECKCGHWKPGRRVYLPEVGRRRGIWNLDIQDANGDLVVRHEDEEEDSAED